MDTDHYHQLIVSLQAFQDESATCFIDRFLVARTSAERAQNVYTNSQLVSFLLIKKFVADHGLITRFGLINVDRLRADAGSQFKSEAFSKFCHSEQINLSLAMVNCFRISRLIVGVSAQMM